MERTYRINIELEATFKRTVDARAMAQNFASILKDVTKGGSWSVVHYRARQVRVKSNRKPIERAPNATETLKAHILERARRIASELRAVDPTIPRVTIRWVYEHDGGCGSQSSGHWVAAHAHKGQWYTYRSWDSDLRVRLPKNLICLQRPKHPNWSRDDAYLAWLMAHEMTHIRMERGHRTKHFSDMVDRVLQRWKDWKATDTEGQRTHLEGDVHG